MPEKSKVIKSEDIGQKVSLEGQLNMGAQSNAASSDKKILSQSDVLEATKAKGILAEALNEAENIKNKARAIFMQVSDKMEEARKQGFEKGREEGLATVTEQLVSIRKQNEALLEQIERQAVELVGEIGQKIIGARLEESDEAVIGLIREALKSSLGNELIIFVSPADYQRLHGHENQLMSTLSAMQTVQLKASETVTDGGCVIESELGTIDARFEIQMEAIKKALEV